MTNLFTEHFTYFLMITFLLGLAIGSFLNVVIYRLPIMIIASWRQECCELLQAEHKADKAINLMWPRSYCTQCQQQLRNWHNIPVISYLLLKGKCTYCKYPISYRYPFIELLTALLTLFLVAHYGFSWQMLAVLIFTWGLLALIFIDLEHQMLPDIITLPLLWLGLLINMAGLFTDLPSAVIGAAAGYLSLWIVAKLFQLLTNKVGMGHGDFKLLALLGAWLGWQALPLVILLASFVGAIVGISLILFKKHGRNVPIPFGPYLAIAGWIGLVFNGKLSMVYSWLI